MPLCPRTREALRGVVSGEFATGNGLTSSTAPIMSSLVPAGANLTSTGEVILWGCVCNRMRLLRRVRGTHTMVATLKRPPPGVSPSSRPGVSHILNELSGRNTSGSSHNHFEEILRRPAAPFPVFCVSALPLTCPLAKTR